MAKIPLQPNQYYHIYNHANGRENLFENEGNYYYFLKRYAKFINPIADTFAYCLMPNHFHVAIKIKSQAELEEIIKNTRYDDVQKYCSKQFSNLFSSYTQAFNKQQSRRGSLFIPNFSRKLVEDESYFKNLIHYIHFNPVHHGFVADLRDWIHSSFENFFSEKSSKVKREVVLDWFENKNQFFDFHQKEIDNRMVLELEEY